MAAMNAASCFPWTRLFLTALSSAVVAQRGQHGRNECRQLLSVDEVVFDGAEFVDERVRRLLGHVGSEPIGQ
eukprot:CAMPEP_0180046226 /NCGR_PEP_ID=MMETSP0984-20121128/36976_1 /TAXON_ID=483367 /ORGANISM="non described non described, Strain CCMP 2436" /LENGTH=71 /DNA_ID=CAMNT_0021974711 /DNA_START=56 /DNA_END=271 /DNA_ORIENTATION=+